jgi:hypothetical protein
VRLCLPFIIAFPPQNSTARAIARICRCICLNLAGNWLSLTATQEILGLIHCTRRSRTLAYLFANFTNRCSAA